MTRLFLQQELDILEAVIAELQTALNDTTIDSPTVYASHLKKAKEVEKIVDNLRSRVEELRNVANASPVDDSSAIDQINSRINTMTNALPAIVSTLTERIDNWKVFDDEVAVCTEKLEQYEVDFDNIVNQRVPQPPEDSKKKKDKKKKSKEAAEPDWSQLLLVGCV